MIELGLLESAVDGDLQCLAFEGSERLSGIADDLRASAVQRARTLRRTVECRA